MRNQFVQMFSTSSPQRTRAKKAVVNWDNFKNSTACGRVSILFSDHTIEPKKSSGQTQRRHYSLFNFSKSRYSINADRFIRPIQALPEFIKITASSNTVKTIHRQNVSLQKTNIINIFEKTF